MSRGYGKYRRGGGSHPSFHFDSLFKENSNRPSAARSAATVGKWGITSFTSIRTLNGLSRSENDSSASVADAAPKPKKFFKSRNTDPPDLSPTYSKSPPSYAPPKKSKTTYEPSDRTTRASSPRKFFSSKSTSEKTVLSSNHTIDFKHHIPQSAKRLFKANELQDYEIARRSMQQDPSSSPAPADTPSEFPLFTSPKDESDLSPQYIPAEKYELERKAMYDNLLRPNSPKNANNAEPKLEDSDSFNNSEHSTSEVNEDGMKEEEDTREEVDNKEVDMEIEQVPEVSEAIPIDPVPEEPTETEDQIEEENEAEEASIPSPQAEPEREQEPTKNPTIDEDWTTDTDSNSTTLECEVKQILPDPSYTVNQISEHKDEILDKILEKPPEQAPPVKLVISKKKGSIFKSRTLVDDSGSKKRRALYKHKWIDDNKDESKEPSKTNEEGENSTNKSPSMNDEFGFKDDPLERIINEDDEGEITSVKCSKSDKGYYTVVRNVKKAHQIQEIGEFQEFNDDVEYILDTLQSSNPISTRCLSAITLASKCMVPAFRMHVRAHGTVAKFFKALHDATKDQSLGLCTATVMFVLSQDRLNMDLDRDCLELMLNLLESDVSYQQALDVCGLSSAQLEKNKQKVRELCAEIQSQGHAMHLNLESITVGQLAMETLLSLTSKRAGEWFKEELRELGGLEHIMKTIHECCRQVSDYVVTWTDTLLDKLRKVDRCLRVLENVTHNNEENQNYILKYSEGVILDTLVNLYKLCDGEIPLYPITDITDKTSTGTIIREALLVTLKVLINLTHHFNNQSIGSQLIGSRPGIIETSLHLLLQVPNYIPEQKKFELGVLVLMLLINLIQDQEANKKLLIEAKAPSKLESIYSREESAVEALITQFYHWEGCARVAESKTNAILDGEKDGEDTPTPKSNEEFIEETVAKLLQKAGTHMEYTFLASYIVMLVGFLIMENPERQVFVRQFLRGGNFADMVELLKKFFNFMNLTASTEASSVCAMKATEKVIKFLEECDKPPEPETTDKPAAFYENTGMDLSFRLTP
ncbi:hypothetical protein JTB14_000647 [Gonioctena quinquepunctata]|nr:hypothetical protein JTB14_000647 [Gonioctena quinquepunctata]